MNELPSIVIVDYLPEHQRAFRELNKAWIEQYFVMEEADFKALDNPEPYILHKGGAIVVALCNNEVAGVCALIKLNDEKYDYELAKMAVSPKFQGRGIGYILGKGIIEKAKQLKAKTIYLESNTKLIPAINLY